MSSVVNVVCSIKMYKNIAFMVVNLLLIFVISACTPTGPQYLVGAGHKSGYYYPAADLICKSVNKSQKQFNCSAKTTSGGSSPNIRDIVSGSHQFGIAQSDIVYKAWNGSDDWSKTGQQKSLRAVLSLYAESVTLVAADDAGIVSIQDLVGKKVNLGKPGSGHRIMATQALEAAGINWEKDLVVSEEKASQGPGLLQEGSVDVFFYVLAHPSTRIKRAISGKRKAHFIPINNIETLLKAHPYYARTSIPISWYPDASNTEDVQSFGVKALLITSADVPENIVYTYAKETISNIDMIQSGHPACRFLEKSEMTEALSIPVHNGALRYFKESALIAQ